MGAVIEKILFFIFVLPALMYEEGYPYFERFIERKGWGMPKLWLAVFALSIIAIALFGFGYDW